MIADTLRRVSIIAVFFSPSAALAEGTWAYSTSLGSIQPVYKAVPSVGVPAQADTPVYRRSFSAGQGVFEVRGDFDPDSPGEEWSALPAFRTVIDAYGNRQRVKVEPKDYTAVRWRRVGE